MKRLSAVIVGIILVLAALTTAHADDTLAFGINDAGTVVGWYEGASGGTSGFSLSGGTSTTLNYPGAWDTYAYGINDAGAIVGSYYTPGADHGFILSGGTYTALNYPAFGINNAGTIVLRGGFMSSGGTYTPLNYPGAVWSAVWGINDAGTIVGSYLMSYSPGSNPNSCCFSGAEGFSLSGGTYTSLNYPGALYTYAYGINDAGTIVGYYEKDGTTSGFSLSGGTYTSLNYPGASYTFAQGINDAGTIVGYYWDAGGRAHGFSLSGTTYSGINLPIPGAILLLAPGLVGLAAIRRKTSFNKQNRMR